MTQVTDAEVADLCLGIYGYDKARIVAWSAMFTDEPDGLKYGLFKKDDTSILVFEGTTDFIGWRKNFDAWPTTYHDHPAFGPVHAGFFAGLEEAWHALKPIVGDNVIVAGHSRGAAQARLMCALMKQDGLLAKRRVLFGSPRAGFKQLGDYLRDVPENSYVNGDEHHHDMVTDVAYWFPHMPWSHCGDPIHVVARPPENDRWGPFAWHHMSLYQQALKNAPSGTA